MKSLVVSLKTGHEALEDFKMAYRKAKNRRLREPHYEISFDNRRDFERFTRNIHILSYILVFKPKSLYELAKLCGMDMSNLNKLIVFFEGIGAVKLKEQTLGGRAVRTPTLEYERIEFHLAA